MSLLGNSVGEIFGTPRRKSLSRAALDGFAADPDYAPFGSARQAGSVSNFHVIDDTDIAGTIPYLKAG